MLCFVVLPSLADDEDFDIENVKTPTKLAELLPEGGIDAVDVEYWLLTKTTKDGFAWGSERYSFCTIKPIDGRLVFTVQYGYAGANGYHRMSSSAYTADGKLDTYEELMHSRGKIRRKLTGKVVEDELVIKTTIYNNDGQISHDGDTRKVALKDFEGAVPSHWIPLVMAYHVREGSLGYRFTSIDMSRSNERSDTVVEDIGTQNVEHNGKPANAHVLMSKRTVPNSRNKTELSTQYQVLENGEVMAMKTTSGTIRYNSERAASEKIIHQFALDLLQVEKAEE